MCGLIMGGPGPCIGHWLRYMACKVGKWPIVPVYFGTALMVLWVHLTVGGTGNKGHLTALWFYIQSWYPGGIGVVLIRPAGGVTHLFRH